MNPVRVFLSIFAFGIALTLILGIIGYRVDFAAEDAERGPQAQTHPAFMQSCIQCHGADLRGVGNAPGILNLAHLTEDEILHIVVNGIGGMPGGMYPEGREQDVVDYLLSIQDH